MTRIQTAVVVLGSLMASLAFAQAQVKVQKIFVQEEPSETVIHIAVDQTPTFTVFKLDNPVRIFIDIPRADVSQVSEPIVVENGVVEQVGTLQFKSSGNPVGRVIVGLKEEVPYDIQSDKGGIVVKIDGAKRVAKTGMTGVTQVQNAEIEKEKALLEEIRKLREQEEALLKKEQETRKRVEALNKEAIEAREKAIAEAQALKEKAKSEEERLKGIERSKEEALKRKEEVDRATQDEARRLEALQRERELLEKQRLAIEEEAKALEQRALAARLALEKAEAQKKSEEQANVAAMEARKALERALQAEKEKLEAVRAAREAEEKRTEAARAVALEETRKLEEARKAREREESIIASLREAKAKAEEVKALAQENKKAKEELEAWQGRVKSLEAELEKVRNEENIKAMEREKAYAKAMEALKQREAEVQETKSRLKTMEDKVVALQAERDKLETLAREALAEKAKIAREAEEAKKNLEDREVALREVSEKVRKLEQEVSELAKMKEQEAEKVKVIEVQKQEALAKWEEAKRRASEEEQKVLALQEERKKVEEKLLALREELKSAQVDKIETEEARELKQEVSRKEAEIERLKKALEEEKGKATKEALAREEALKAELQAREKEWKALQARYEEALARVVEEGKKRDVALKELGKKYEAAMGEVEKAKEELAAKEAEVARLRRSLEERKGEANDEARKMLSDAEARVRALKEEYERRVEQANRIAEEREREVQRLSLELKALKGNNEAKGLREEVSRKEAEIERLKKALEEEKGKATKEAVAREEALRAELEAKERELRALEARFEEARKVAEDREKKVRMITEEMKALKEQTVNEREKDLKELTSRLEAREVELQALRKAYEDARKKGTNQSQRLQELEKGIKDKEKEITSLRKEYESKKSLWAKEVREKEAQIVALEGELRALKARQEAESARRETSLMKELDATKSEVDKLKTEIESLKKVQAKENYGKTVVRGIEFRSENEEPQVVVKTDGAPPDFRVERQSENHYVLVLHNGNLPKELKRKLDVSAFTTAIKSISAFDTKDGDVRIVVEMGSPVGQRIAMKEGEMVWRFSGPPLERMIAAKGPSPVPAGTQEGEQQKEVQQGAREAAAQEGVEIKKPLLVPKKKKYKGKRINLTVKDADIQNVLTFLAREGKVNIVTSEDVQGKVTFHLEDVPWDLALDTILKSKGLDYVIEQGIYRVAPVDVIQKEMESAVTKKAKVEELKPVVVRLIPVNYADANDLLARVTTVLSPRGSVTVDQRTNTLVVKDTEDYLKAAEDLVKRLDLQTPQILIEARIVEARTTFKEDIGIQWGGRYAMTPALGNETGLVFPSSVGVAGGADDPSAPLGGINMQNPNFVVNLPAAVGAGTGGAIGLQLGSIGGAGNLSLRLSAAEEQGEVKLISSPRVSTLDNKKATIAQGVSIPISVVSAAGVNTQFFSADLKLEVTPHVTRDGHVAMKIDITKNEPDFGNVAANGNPTIQRKEAHTELMIKDGDTAVIGGIYTRNTGKSYKKVPFFGDIPVLGWFFKSRSRNDDRSELLIFISPKVINREVSL